MFLRRESNDRQFVDIYILDGLRAKDVARISGRGEAGVIEAATAKWTNPLDDLGQRILAADDTVTENGKLNIATEAIRYGNVILASDVIASLAREQLTEMDFENLELRGGEFIKFPLDERALKNLTITDSWFGELTLPVKNCENVRISDSAATKVTGISSAAALPYWIHNLETEADTFDSVASVSRIRKIGLKPAHEILITIIRKTFFQRGAGRKEEALLRGLGKLAARSLSTKILNILIREGLLTTFKGDEGIVYSPVRANSNRMQKLLDELSASRDLLWIEVGQLK